MNDVHSAELFEMAKSHFNEPAIFGFEVARVIGYGETAIDCYILARHPGGKVIWHTCVGGYVFLDRLKGQDYVRSHSGEDWDDLFRIDSALSLNGCPKEDVFRVDLQHDDHECFSSPSPS